ncbi:D-alanyl-D-alanine carboxypeptidase [Candidatus Uhrbacteria bacterium]|nr:D-alanyl-D-alanine carboxypeptidase [Candidatus Uhrbacteria bacterium]
MNKRIIITLFLFLSIAPAVASAQLLVTQDEWVGMLDANTVKRGYTMTTQSREGSIGIPANVLPGPTRALLRRSVDREAAASALAPRDGMRYASDLFYYEFFDVAALQGEVVLALESKPVVRRAGVYLFDPRTQQWFPLRTTAVSSHYFRAHTDVLSGYVAVLEYENDDAEFLSLIASARAVVAADGDDHLYVAHHSRDVYPIASLTKLMTALIFLEHNPGWNTRVTIAKQDDTPPAKLAFQTGDVVTARALFDSMLVGSKNNGAQALSRASGLSRNEFVKKMNEKAQKLGMKDTRFVDVTGLSPGNKGAARDIALLARAALSNGDIRSAAGKRAASVGLLNRKKTFYVPTTNDLIASGMKTLGKTGYLPEVGYNLALIKNQNNKPIVFVILGAPTSDDRFALGKRLLERPW